MERFKVIAFTHKNVELEQLSKFFIEESAVSARLQEIKAACGIDELVYIATCNRIEFLIVTEKEIDLAFLSSFFFEVNPKLIAEEYLTALVYEGEAALRHIFEVASSLDSLVVGEREIITQVRKAFDIAKAAGITGDLLRLVEKATVKTAKEVYTHTKIAEKSVSVVFLAYQMLREVDVKLNARVLIIGAGQTNTTMAKYLKKHGFQNFAVFNRSLENAQTLSDELGGKSYSLDQLENYTEGFDVIISCTGSSTHMVSENLYERLLMGETSRKVLIDLAIPHDIDPSIHQKHKTTVIEISKLKEIASRNLGERQSELEAATQLVESNISEFKTMLKHRKVELAMQDVPKMVKEIKNTALNTVFASDIQKMDEQSREVLEKVMAYMEKKYISMPMIMAKDILIGNN